jgi:hypothetical protein
MILYSISKTFDGLGIRRAANSDSEHSTRRQKSTAALCLTISAEAARNLIKAGVDRRMAMKITGHKTEAIFERYNIKTLVK